MVRNVIEEQIGKKTNEWGRGRGARGKGSRWAGQGGKEESQKGLFASGQVALHKLGDALQEVGILSFGQCPDHARWGPPARVDLGRVQQSTAQVLPLRHLQGAVLKPRLYLFRTETFQRGSQLFRWRGPQGLEEHLDVHGETNATRDWMPLGAVLCGVVDHHPVVQHDGAVCVRGMLEVGGVKATFVGPEQGIPLRRWPDPLVHL